MVFIFRFSSTRYLYTYILHTVKRIHSMLSWFITAILLMVSLTLFDPGFCSEHSLFCMLWYVSLLQGLLLSLGCSVACMCATRLYTFYCLFMHLNIFFAVHLLKIIARLHTKCSFSREKKANIFLSNFFLHFYTLQHTLRTAQRRYTIFNNIIIVME